MQASFFAEHISPATNLIAQVVLFGSLLMGAFLARRQRFRAHGWVQGSVVLLNLVFIFAVMLPSFRHQLWRKGASESGTLFYGAGIIHAILGTTAELGGLYVVLTATSLLPKKLRFENFKPWMRSVLALWTLAVVSGGIFYGVSQAGAAPSQGGQATAAEKADATINVTNFSFDPPSVTVSAGSTVEWVDVKGRHEIEADNEAFHSPTLIAGNTFRFKFDKPGVYPYYCVFHGSRGGKDMAGTITVEAKK